MTYKGRAKGGVVVLDEDVKLPDGAAVEVSSPEQADDSDAPTLLERLKPVVGKAQGPQPDASRNIYRDLYGRAQP